MEPQMIPNGTLVLFNANHAWTRRYDPVLCEVLEPQNLDDAPECSVYRLRCDAHSPQVFRDDIDGMINNEFWCHVGYFEPAPLPEIDAEQLSSLL